MRAICFEQPGVVTVQSLDDPRIVDPGDAIVQVAAAGLCGSDLHVFHGRETGIDIPTAMGHEFVGEVVEVGGDVRRVRVGQRVCSPFSTSCGDCFFCRTGLSCRCQRGRLFGWRQAGEGLHGGQAELVRVPLADTTLVDATGIDDRLALLLGDNLPTGCFAADLAAAGPDQQVVVIGCGTVGLIAIHAALRKGVQNIVAIDRIPHRLQWAARLGAQTCSSDREAHALIADATAGRGADAVMELVGLPAAQRLAFDLLRPGGTLATIGCHSEPGFAFSPVDAYDKNLTYRAGRCPARHYMTLLEAPVRNGDFEPLQQLVTHQFDLNDGVAAYQVFANRRDNCIKAICRTGR